MKVKVSLALSIGIHLAVVLILALSSGGNGGGSSAAQDEADGNSNLKESPHVKVEEKLAPVPTEVELVALPEESDKGFKQVDVDKECPNNWYGGLGILLSGPNRQGEHRIMEVYKGYGGEQSGLLKGDILLAASDPDIKGDPGTPIRLTIRRGQSVLAIDAIRTKVCYSDK